MSENTVFNFDQIEKRINENTFKLNSFAKEINCTEAELKKALILFFGDRIEFRRGRNGGVYFKKETNVTNNS